MFIEIIPENRKAVQISYGAWLIRRNVDASKIILYGNRDLVFDFELFIGGRSGP
jgi:hypothetical protein